MSLTEELAMDYEVFERRATRDAQPLVLQGTQYLLPAPQVALHYETAEEWA
jgi:hypothetical protein